MNSELLDFTRRALAAGIARPDIAGALKGAGWADADIAAALASFAEVEFPVPVPKPQPYLSAWEVFVYLVMFLSLYATAFNLTGLVFDFINLGLPDPLQPPTDPATLYDSIRWHISALMVLLPLFLFMFNLVGRTIARDLTKRSSRPRKWLTYLTMFIAVMALVGDLGTLVYNVLGGELTGRFMLKVLTVAAIAGGIFAYFLIDIREDEAP
jgi:quinol-cytochrome oxidoreductase complex cytochrome b subunit